MKLKATDLKSSEKVKQDKHTHQKKKKLNTKTKTENKNSPIHLIIKLLKTKDKEVILKPATGKCYVTSNKTMI